MASPRRLISDRFPFVPLTLVIRGATWEAEAFVDTGFEGDIAIPTGFLPREIRPSSHLRWRTADGRRVEAPSYVGLVRFEQLGEFRVAVTMLGDELLIGRGLTDRLVLTLDHGRRLILEP